MQNFDGFKDSQGNCKTGLHVLDKVAEMARKKVDENRKSTFSKVILSFAFVMFLNIYVRDNSVILSEGKTKEGLKGSLFYLEE